MAETDPVLPEEIATQRTKNIAYTKPKSITLTYDEETLDPVLAVTQAVINGETVQYNHTPSAGEIAKLKQYYNIIERGLLRQESILIE